MIGSGCAGIRVTVIEHEDCVDTDIEMTGAVRTDKLSSNWIGAAATQQTPIHNTGMPHELAGTISAVQEDHSVIDVAVCPLTLHVKSPGCNWSGS